MKIQRHLLVDDEHDADPDDRGPRDVHRRHRRQLRRPRLPERGIHGLAEQRGRVGDVQRGNEPRRRDGDELNRQAPEGRERDDVADRRVVVAVAEPEPHQEDDHRRDVHRRVEHVARLDEHGALEEEVLQPVFAREGAAPARRRRCADRPRSRGSPSAPRSCRRPATARRARARSRARVANGPNRANHLRCDARAATSGRADHRAGLDRDVPRHPAEAHAPASRGRPSTFSPRMLRCTSLVPPPIVSARAYM